MTQIDPAHRAPRSTTLRLWLIIGSVTAALAVLPAAFMGMMSVMASDAGVNTMIYLLIYTMLSFPIAIVVGPALAWVAYAMRREKAAWILLFSPFAWVLALIVIFSLGLGEPRPM